MKLYLFGGAEADQGQFLPQLKLIETIIQEINPTQILHIPFARVKTNEGSRSDGRFQKHIQAPQIEYLNAKHNQDIQKAESPLIFISGGGNNINLIQEIHKRPKLLELIKNASHLIGESAGAKVLGTKIRTKGSDPQSKIIDGLDILKNCIIEPHYTERNRQDVLTKNLNESKLGYGIGIDCVTALICDSETFPIYQKIGQGKVIIQKNI